MKKTILIAAFLLIGFASFSQVTISGHVWNDANGLTDLQINHSGGDIDITNGLNFYLVNDTGNIILQAVNNVFECFTFYNVPENAAYKIVLSWTVKAVGSICPVAAFPASWLIVGENLGSGPLSGSDHVRDGILHITVESENITDANFGIKQIN